MTDETALPDAASVTTEPEKSASREAVLRQSLLEHLLEYWYSQDETLQLAATWTAYEDAIVRAKDVAEAEFLSNSGSFFEAQRAAVAAVRAIEGLSKDQERYALSAAFSKLMPAASSRSGHAYTARANVRQRRNDMGLLAAQLLTLVADFELFVSRVTSAWLRFDQNHLAGKNRTLTFNELSNFESIEDIQESMIDDFLEDLMRKSASGWFEEFSKMFGGAPIHGAKDFTTLEAFQRRHIFVHHGGVVSRQYLKALKNFPLSVSLGDGLSVDLDYVHRAADALACAAHSIAMAALVHSSAGSNADKVEAEKEAGELTFILLTLGRDRVVDRFLANYRLSAVKDNFAREQLRVNGWIAKRRLGTLDQVRTELDEWDTSAADDQFKLARLILLGQKAEAVEMATRMIRQKRLNIRAVTTWPLFEELYDQILENIREQRGPADKGSTGASFEPRGDTSNEADAAGAA